MPTAPHPLHEAPCAADTPAHAEDANYWYSLIDQKAAANFMGLVPRTMEGFRQRGEGPRFVRISGRCIKYRRIDLREYSEAQLRTSTSDAGQAVA